MGAVCRGLKGCLLKIWELKLIVGMAKLRSSESRKKSRCMRFANTGVWHGKQMGSKMKACLGFFALRQACLQKYRAETHKSRLSYFKALGVKPLSLYYIRFSGKRLGGIRNSVSVLLLQKRIGRPPVSVSPHVTHPQVSSPGWKHSC